MLSTQHTQSLTDFRQKATETLDRLNETGDAEIITVNGVARAILLAPAIYDQLARESQLNTDISIMRQAMSELKAGKGRPADAVFNDLHNSLLTKKRNRARKARK